VKLTIPTMLTLARIVMIPVLVVVFYLPYAWTSFAAAAVFGLAAITDWLDGWIARRYGQFSAFGAFLDPVADKLMVATALFLIVQGHPTAWMALWAAVIVGREIALPNLGRETLHHVHADDVAQAFMGAMANWSGARGESFHVVSGAAVTLGGYAEAVSRWFGHEPRVRFLPWEEWRKTVSEKEAGITWDHIARSPSCSIRKAERLLDYQPRYSSLEAVRESVLWLLARGMIQG